jgi:hypothetical protein
MASDDTGQTALVSRADMTCGKMPHDLRGIRRPPWLASGVRSYSFLARSSALHTHDRVRLNPHPTGAVRPMTTFSPTPTGAGAAIAPPPPPPPRAGGGGRGLAVGLRDHDGRRDPSRGGSSHSPPPAGGLILSLSAPRCVFASLTNSTRSRIVCPRSPHRTSLCSGRLRSGLHRPAVPHAGSAEHADLAKARKQLEAEKGRWGASAARGSSLCASGSDTSPVRRSPARGGVERNRRAANAPPRLADPGAPSHVLSRVRIRRAGGMQTHACLPGQPGPTAVELRPAVSSGC